MSNLLRRSEAVAWELRTHLLYEREIILRLVEGASLKRLRGNVVSVHGTGQTCQLEDARFEDPVTVPVSMIESIRRPHFHEPEDGLLPAPPPARRELPYIDPNQMTLGGDPPEVSRRTAKAMIRATGLLLEQEQLDVLAALDRACTGRRDARTIRVAEHLGRSPEWTTRRLARLAEMRLVFLVKERPNEWAPGE